MEPLASLPFEIDWARAAAVGARVAVILAVGGAAYTLLALLRRRIARMQADRGAEDYENYARRKTLATVVTTGGIAGIGTVTLMMVLDEIGIPLGPLLATAGIAGLAIGFGAQTLVKDVISGFFILLENQYSIGDVVAAAGVDGAVEEVNLRTTILRDLQGTVHVIPNGEIRVLSNRTKGWARVVLEIGIGYQEDPDRVISILEDVGQDLYDDPEFGSYLLEPPTVPGVEAFGDSAVRIRMLARTRPLQQWDLARELRRRIKRRFDREGIEIPFPQRTVWHREPERA